VDTIVSYLTDLRPGFGFLAAIFLGLQIVLIGAGVYLVFLRKDPHMLRGPALRRLGIALLTLGIAGIIVGSLRLAAVVPFTARYWFYLIALFELALAVFVEIYRRTTYRAQAVELARSKSVRRSSPVATKSALSTSVPSNHNAQPVPIRQTRPSAANSRRDARRDRKRRKR
jgi:hypothetical protein